MSFFVTYKKVTSKNVRIPTERGMQTVLKYGFVVKYKFQGSSKLKEKFSGYSFDSEQEAKKAMKDFELSLNPTKSKQPEMVEYDPEVWAKARKQHGLPPFDPNNPLLDSFKYFFISRNPS
jgi:hypothetical protein